MRARGSLTFLSLFLKARGSFLGLCVAGTVGTLSSLAAGSMVMSLTFSEATFSESAEPVEFESDVTTVFLLPVLSLSIKGIKKGEGHLFSHLGGKIAQF